MEAATAALEALTVEDRDTLIKKYAGRLILQEKKIGQFKGAVGAQLNPSDSKSSTTTLQTLVPVEDNEKALSGFIPADTTFCARVWEYIVTSTSLLERVPKKGDDEEDVVQPFINEVFNAIHACAHKARLPCNKLLHEYGTTGGSGGPRPDWVVLQPFEQRRCMLNTCFFVEAKQVETIRQRAGKGVTGKSTAVLVREGVAQLMQRIANRREDTGSPHGIGIVVNGPSIAILRIEFKDDNTDVVFPSYVTQLLPLFEVPADVVAGGVAAGGAAASSAAARGGGATCPIGLHWLITLMLEQNVERFGLRRQAGLELSGLRYVRMLGTGGFCFVAEFTKDGFAESFAAKFARHSADKELAREKEVLQALRRAEVPRVPSFEQDLTSAAGKQGLLLTPVGTPLLEHLADKSPADAGRWELAVRVVTCLADTLQRAHAVGIVHGDVRPSNVILVGTSAFLIDWGLGSINESQMNRCRTHLFGVPAFMADDLVKMFDLPPKSKWKQKPDHDMCALVYTFAAIAYFEGAGAPWETVIGPAATDAFILARLNWLREHMLPKKTDLPDAVQSALDDILTAAAVETKVETTKVLDASPDVDDDDDE